MTGGSGRIAGKTYHRGQGERQTHRRDAEGAENPIRIAEGQSAQKYAMLL